MSPPALKSTPSKSTASLLGFSMYPNEIRLDQFGQHLSRRLCLSLCEHKDERPHSPGKKTKQNKNKTSYLPLRVTVFFFVPLHPPFFSFLSSFKCLKVCNLYMKETFLSKTFLHLVTCLLSVRTVSTFFIVVSV